MGSSSKASYVLRDTNFLKINIGSTKIYRMAPAFGDLDNDGKVDLLLGDQNGSLHYYKNIGSGKDYNFTKISDNYFNIYAGTFATPQLVDLNKDNVLDLILGRKNGTLAYFENKGNKDSALFLAEPSIDSIGKINISQVALSPGQPPFYFPGYSNPHVVDLDKDGNFEVLVGAESGRVHLFRNFDANANRVCEEITNIYSDFPTATARDYVFGTRSAPFCGDIDGDGIKELMIGNTRGGLQLYNPVINGIISSVSSASKESFECVLFPNPSKGQFMLRFNQSLKKASYTIYSLTGAEIASGEVNGYEQLIDLNLSKGLYIFSLKMADGGKLSRKILVE
jgi:hypothetical protein